MPSQTPKRAGKYSRVSDDSRRREAASVRQQDERNQQVCDEHGWITSPRHAYSDNDLSASRFARKDRPGWDRLLADLRAGEIDVLVMWESSRGGRTPENWLAFLSVCRDRGILVHVTTHQHTYDARIPRDWKTLAEEGIGNAYFSEEASLRVLRAMEDVARAGMPHGICPYGYSRVYDSRTRAVLGQDPDPETAPVAREIICLIAAGHAASRIARTLNEPGLPSPGGREWTAHTVLMIARNPAYISMRLWKGELIPCQWEPLVTPAQWWGARAVMRARQESFARTGHAVRAGRACHLLSILARCGKCQDWLRWRGANAKRARPLYQCRRGCASIVADWLDTWVAELAILRMASDDIYPDLAGEPPEALAEAEGVLAALEHGYRDLKDRAGDLSVEMLIAAERKMLPALIAAREHVQALRVPPVLRNLAGSPADDIRARWEQMPVAAKRDVLRALFARIELNPAAPGVRGSHEFDSERIVTEWRAAEPS